MANKVAEIITERVLKKLEQGIIPWRKPWAGSKGAVSHATGKPYSLINQLLLDCGGEYITFNELQKEGGKIRKGAKALPVVFWKMYEKEDKETGEVETIPVLRYYNVFNVADCEGIEPKYNADNPVKHADKDGYAERIVNYYVNREKITLNREQASGKAFYRPSDDSITVPAINQFQHTAEYYSTLFHEMTHSTGHSSRLKRLTKVASFGSKTYSKEELVAEIGAACLVNKCGLETESSFTNSAAYIQSWSKTLKDDPNLFISAAGKAEKAFNFIIDGLPEEQPEPEQPEASAPAEPVAHTYRIEHITDCGIAGKGLYVVKDEENNVISCSADFKKALQIWQTLSLKQAEPAELPCLSENEKPAPNRPIWKRGNGYIKTNEGYKPVSGYVSSFGDNLTLIIHKTTGGKSWQITHAESGLLVQSGYGTLKYAKADVETEESGLLLKIRGAIATDQIKRYIGELSDHLNKQAA